ncbi:MAG: hypothetical protein KKG67_20405 [Gammaproteobacteria bacterium]|nr:hypothetical protein [Gammaproteobacteria bacterium]
MSLSMANMCLLAKAQTVLGTPVVPTPGDNAILCRNANPALIKGKFIDRNLIRGARGNYGAMFAGTHRTIDFEVEAAGSGAAGTPPKYGVLLQGCDMSETITPTTSVVYQPTHGAAKPITLYGYLDGVLFRLSDAKGTWQLTTNAEEIPVFKFNYIGKYHPLEDAAFPTGLDFDDFMDPQTVGFDNTPTFNVHGVPGVMQQFSLDLANQLVWRDLVGFAGVRIPDRKPKCTVVMEMTDVATKNWGEVVRTSQKGAIELVHGLGAGRVLTVDMPRTGPDAEPTISDLDRVAMFNGSFSVEPSAGNDEVTLTFT